VDLSAAIKRTTDYAKRHGGLLTLEELKKRLISEVVYEDKEIEREARGIGKFPEKIPRTGNKKMRKAQVLVKKHLARFGDILMVGVTGSVAAGYPDRNDDIDLLVVTRRKRLWLTRLVLRIYVRLKGIPHRSYLREEKKDQFCFNLWLTEESLGIPIERQGLSAAVDLVMMRVLLNRDHTYEKMIVANHWAKKYVATGYKRLNQRFGLRQGFDGQTKRFGRNNWLGNLLNWLVFWPQYWYMRGKIRNEIIDMDRAFFNH